MFAACKPVWCAAFNGMDNIDVLIERIATRLSVLGLSEREVSVAATGKPDALRYIRARRAMPALPRLLAIASELRTTPAYLLGASDQEEATDDEQRALESREFFSEKALRQLAAQKGAGASNYAVVFGSEIVAHEQFIADSGLPILVPFSSMLKKIAGVYQEPSWLQAAETTGFYCADNTMSPAFPKNSLVITTRHNDVRAGDYGVFYLNASSAVGDRPGLAYALKLLVRIEAEAYVVRQYQPDQVFRLPKSNVFTVDRVIRYEELVQAGEAKMPQN